MKLCLVRNYSLLNSQVKMMYGNHKVGNRYTNIFNHIYHLNIYSFNHVYIL